MLPAPTSTQKKECQDCDLLRKDKDEQFYHMYGLIIQLVSRINELEKEKNERSVKAETTPANFDFFQVFNALQASQVQCEPARTPEEQGAFSLNMDMSTTVTQGVKDEMNWDMKSEEEPTSSNTIMPNFSFPTTPSPSSSSSSSSSSSHPMQLSELFPTTFGQPETKKKRSWRPKYAEVKDPSDGCVNCQTTVSTAWRKNSQNQRMCNPCGLYERIHKTNRPTEMKKNVIQQRSRRSKVTGPTGSISETIETVVEAAAAATPELSTKEFLAQWMDILKK